MALRLVIGACTNEYVAGWALQSMGGELATQTRREAARAKARLRDASSPKSCATSSAPPTFPPGRMLRDPCAEPISRYWLRSASYSLTVRLAEHEAEPMIGA